MDIEVVKTICYTVFALIIGINVVYFFILNYQSDKRNALPVETCRAVAYHKDPEIYPTIDGRRNTCFFQIVFHTETGDILKLYMGRAQYYQISEGAWGELTWQGKRFWGFRMDDGKEVRT